MRCRNGLRFGLVFLLLILLTACDRPTQNITAVKITADLEKHAITGLNDWEFTFEGPRLIELQKVDYADRAAEAQLVIKAINVQERTGAVGEAVAEYLYSEGAWRLNQVRALSIEPMDRHYAARLAELVDFPLHLAANLGDRPGVAAALRQGTSVDAPEAKKQSTALMFAAERGFADIVETLVAKGADVNHRNAFGFSPLHAAVSGDHLAVAQYLVDHGANVNGAETPGRTPLYLAAERENLDMVRFLVDKGAEVNARSERGWTPLYAAAGNNALEIARYLLEHGAEVNLTTTAGTHSPLLTAAYHNHVEMVELLLTAGADPRAQLSEIHRGYPNFTALDIARRQENQAVVELLEKELAQ
ncbi:MAG: ankyrin repeat domain-containing protein [Desulfuromonadales bacterium]|nr:ankyrin repeat domain-containing protein [Desulfuromonadales bacterium]